MFSLLKIQDNVKTRNGDPTVSRSMSPAERLEALNQKFSQLDLSDYLRSYRDLSGNYVVHSPGPDELEHIYLTYIPVDVVKLDKSLVDNYLVEGKAHFIDDVIRLVHDLKKEMTIEGVEEKWQYLRLKDFGADTIQGYYFSKPLPANDAIRFTPTVM